jgi:hypothetical protein
MKRYLYLNLIPEALVASMLDPVAYGSYLAVGVHRRTNQQAIFIELDLDVAIEGITKEMIEERCVAHPDGSPRKSTYFGIHRVLELVPVEAYRNLYLVTEDGRVLELERGEINESSEISLHLYQELAPMQPLVASSFGPKEFCRFITDRSQPVSVDRIAFCDMRLDDLQEDPLRGLADNLPYKDIAHLRDCLNSVWHKGAKDVKVVTRQAPQQIHYRMIRNGVYCGNGSDPVFYPFPSIDELETKHYEWWRSAQI